MKPLLTKVPSLKIYKSGSVCRISEKSPVRVFDRKNVDHLKVHISPTLGDDFWIRYWGGATVSLHIASSTLILLMRITIIINRKYLKHVDDIAQSLVPGTCKRNPVVCCRQPKSVGTVWTRRWHPISTPGTCPAGGAAVDAYPVAALVSMTTTTVRLHRGLRTFGRPTMSIHVRLPRTGTSEKYCLYIVHEWTRRDNNNIKCLRTYGFFFFLRIRVLIQVS